MVKDQRAEKESRIYSENIDLGSANVVLYEPHLEVLYKRFSSKRAHYSQKLIFADDTHFEICE